MFHSIEKEVAGAFHAHIRIRYGIDLAVTIEQPRQSDFGEMAVPAAFQLAKQLRQAPRKIAAELVDEIGPIPGVGAMEVAGELHESLSDRMDELIDPIRKDREWLRFAGSFIVRGGPLPGDFDDKLGAVEVRAFEAAPRLRLMVLEAFERHI